VSGDIAFYFDLVSPYAYVGSVMIEPLAERHGRAVDWRPVLISETILKVMGFKPLTQVPLKGPYLKHDLDRLVRLYDVPFRHHGLSGVNSLAGLRAFVWLKPRDPAAATALARRLFRRLWVEGKDITPPEAVAEEAASLGIDRDALLAAVASDEIKQALRTAVDDAIVEGVFGVPFFIVDGEPIWGSDRIWMVEHWLRHHSWDVAPG
jgi:2-hydroxychromene-2-carboxylate isomerase